jgi:hypothetical protein
MTRVPARIMDKWACHPRSVLSGAVCEDEGHMPSISGLSWFQASVPSSLSFWNTETINHEALSGRDNCNRGLSLNSPAETPNARLLQQPTGGCSTRTNYLLLPNGQPVSPAMLIAAI